MLARLTGKDPETGKKKKAVNESGKLTAYKKVSDGLIFVQPCHGFQSAYISFSAVMLAASLSLSYLTI